MTPPQPVPAGPGQESVWDYPRPPRVEPSPRVATVELAGEVIARSADALRVLETAGAPTLYLPPQDVRMDLLIPVLDHTTYCEWKGHASYFDIVVGDTTAPRAAWTYPSPKPGYEALRDYVSFYPARVACFLDDERVLPQEGGFYGGWITADIVGPFKGSAGSRDW